jgi:predicted ATPase
MLNKILIEGLRGFADKTEISLAKPNGQSGSGLTLLTGPNNSGKSTIIEAIKLRTALHQTPSFHVGMRNAKTDAISITYQLDNYIDVLTSSRKGSSESLLNWTSTLSPYVVPSRRQFSPQFGKANPVPRVQYAVNSSIAQPLRAQTLTGFEGRLFELEKNHAAFNKLLREVFPNFMHWSIDQNESEQYFIKLTSGEKSHSLAGSGDGIISVFVIVAALFDSQPGDLIAIDEPELSLHPTIQNRLAKIVTRFAADRQIVVSTHSPYFVVPEALSNGAQVVRTWDRRSSIEIFQLSIATCKQMSALLSPNANNPHVFGLDAREIFFADDPILVFEGQEDVVFWPKVVASRPSLSALSAYGWGAGGAANMKNVVGVLKALGYRKVCGVLDNNRPQDLANLQASFPDYLFIEIPAPDMRSKKAVPARVKVIGLLDEAGIIRSQFTAELDKRLQELESFVAA